MKPTQRVKVTIITVVYNGADTIEQTINSVRKQDYGNIEYIIIDGGSTDHTREIVEAYRSDIDIFISETDEGLYDAMNKGIAMASGELIGILNSDDLYTNTTISRVVAYYEATEAEVIYGKALWFDDLGKTSLYVSSNPEELWCRMAIPHPTVFVKKEIYKKYGVFNTKYLIAADYELMLRLYSQGVRFGCVDEILAYFRRGGLSAQRQENVIQESMEISLSYLQKCREKEKWEPKIQEVYIRRRFSQLLESERALVLNCSRQLFGDQAGSNHLVIFGTGSWGKRCIQFLEEAGLRVDFWVDNHSLTWGENLYGRQIKAPEELYGYKNCILIATFQFAEEIKRQIETIDSRLVCLCLLDLAKVSVEICEK